MKKRIAILLAACLLLTGAAALAQEADAAEAEAVVAGAEEAVEAAETADEAAGDEGAAAEEDGALPDTPEAGDGEDAGAEPEEEDAAEDDAAEDDAAEEEGGAFTLWFEEGFGLDIPDGWVSYPVTDADRQAGVRYILGDGAAAHYLYILAQPTAARDAEALAERIEAAGTLEKTANLMFADTPFVAFVDDGQDASGCATVWGSEIMTFLFTPRSDSEFMATVTEMMETFRPL